MGTIVLLVKAVGEKFNVAVVLARLDEVARISAIYEAESLDDSRASS